MKNSMIKRSTSLALALLLMVTSVLTALPAFAEGGIVEIYEMEIAYQDGETIVPDKNDEGEDYVESLMESEKLQLTPKLIGCNIPEGGYVRWYSETPTLVDVDDNGLVTAYDSSKGAVIQLWIDNEVKTIPLIGGILGSMLESALFNDTVDIDSMDTDQIIAIVETLFGENSQYGAYTSGFISSLKEYLKKLNCTIHAELCDKDGNVLDDDTIKILVVKSDKWYANFLPNGTHITNKDSIETTVAVGSTVKLEALTTPKRLKYGATFSIQSNSIFNQGSSIAEVDENGVVYFKEKGTVTVVASPRSEDVSKGIGNMIQKASALIASGDISSEQLAEILINNFGVNMNKTVLVALINGAIRAAELAGNMSEASQAIISRMSSVTDSVMKYAYNDTITFTVIDPQPLEDFTIDGPTSVQEGATIQLAIKNIVPSTGDVSDITWSSSNPAVASVDENTGTVTGRDAGGSLGSLSSQTCTITAYSSANDISKSVTIKVTGKTGNYISDAVINGSSFMSVGESETFTCSVYPERNAYSQYLSISWGMVTGTDSETGEPAYTWADSENDVSDGIGSISADGTYTSVKGGLSTIAVKAVTGYDVGGSFYEISSIISTHDIQNDRPVTKISLSAQNAGYVGTLTSTNDIEINGGLYKFATVKLNAVTAYYGRGATVTANVEPAEATNSEIVWHISNESDFYTENETARSIQVRARASVQNSTSTHVWCETADGKCRSEIMVLTVTRNSVTGNTIDGDEITTEVDKDVDVTHTVTFDGLITANYNANHQANWFSSDESIFTVRTLSDRSGNAVITGVDVGTATVYCVSADGGIIDSKTVTVYPNKDYLENVIELCDETVILKTAENKKLYGQYMSKLDKAYYVLYDVPMASQSVCDTTADNLLDAFVKLGGYVGIGEIVILDRRGREIDNKQVTVNVGTLSIYTNNSYAFGYKVVPENSMYSRVQWTSDNSSVKVDSHGTCTPTENKACSAKITCTIRDYLGNETSDYAYISFARTPVTGVTLNKTSIENAAIGESEKLTATVLPNSFGNNAEIDDVVWSSSDSRVASVDNDGTVHFLRGGSCVIIATTVDGGFTAECAVNVVTNFNALNALIASYDAMGLAAEDYYPDTFAPFEAKMADAKQMVSEATASQDEADEMYTSLENAFKALKKYVRIDKIQIYLDGDAASEYYQVDLGALASYSNAKLNLNVRLYPNNGSYESVTWESSTSFIKVDGDGVCSPSENKSGYGKITCTVTDHFGGTFSDYVWVSFAKTPATGVSLDSTAVSGAPNTTAQLTATVKPNSLLSKADIKDVSWTSSNEEVAIVSESGLVTFVSAGVAEITATTYDGGFTATCTATTIGDRSALEAALNAYKDIEFSDYEYEYGVAFKEAYEAAENAMTDMTLTQTQIDTAASDLLEAATALSEHPYIKIENISLGWTASDLTTQKQSGTVGDNDSIQVIATDIARISTNARVKITPSVAPDGAMYSSVSWSTVKSNNMTVSANNSDGTVTVNPTRIISTASNAFAVLKVNYTDGYGREYSRNVSVLIGDAYVTGITINTPDYTAKATAEPVAIQYTLSSSNGNVNSLDNKDVEWTSSDDAIASVDENGVVTHHEEGEVTITARTADGGYTDSITITLTADYDILADAISENETLISENRGKFVYTEESLDALEAAVNDARPIAEERTARQAVVNEKLAAIQSAHDSLELYVPAKGLTLGLNDGESAASVINEGYIRYTGNSLNGKSFKLKVNTIPAGSRYEQIEFASDNSAITVSSDGTVKSTNSTSKVAKITCTITNYDDTSYSYDVYVSFVRYGVTAISFNESDLYYGYNGETTTLRPEITYTSSTNTSSYYVNKCSYVSDNESVATVDDNGVITFVSFGKATITATTLDGGYTATVDVYTTNDIRQLRETLSAARTITYTDYEYAYGIAFRDKYETAVSVYENPTSTQEAIDLAESELSAAMAALEGHPFIAPAPQIITSGGTAIGNNDTLETDGNAKVTVSPKFADGAMMKSYTFTAENLSNAAAVKNDDGSITLTRTAESGTATLKLTVVDDYDRSETLEMNVKLVEQLVPCTDITLLANGEAIEDGYTYHCGGSYSNIDLTIGYIPIPSNSNMIESVTYSSSSSSVKIDSATGKVTMGSLTLLSSYSAKITCTVTNSDSTVVKKTVSISIKRS